MLYCPWVLVAMETHFHVFTLKYQYFAKFLKEHSFKSNFYDFPIICPVRISLVWWLLGSVTMCDSPVILTKIAKNHLNYRRLALNLGAKELRTHFFYSWIWTLTYRRIFFHLFFTKSLHTRYPGVLPLGVKTPKLFVLDSNFLG